MSRSSVIREVEKVTTITADGEEQTKTVEKSTSLQKSDEPDYIKLYTRMWCEFNEIPHTYRSLFFELVARMTYCNAADLGSSQLVNTGKPWSDSIMHALGWKKAMYQKGLRALCECNAIRQISRGVYQVNPQYAGRGEWKYNPKLERGGVEDLIAIFRFKDKHVDTKIMWADNGKDSDFNTSYRDGLQTQAKDDTILKTTSIEPVAVQMEVGDFPEFMPEQEGA